MNKYNTLDAIVKMAKDDNKGIIMSNTVTEVRTDARGYIIGFGVEKKECAESATLQSIGLPNNHICVAFFIDRKELEKYT